MGGFKGVCLLAMLMLGGCEKAMHNGYGQAKNKPLAPSDFFADGRSSRPLVDGAIPHSGGELADASSGRLQILSAGQEASPPRPPIISGSMLERGRERFNIYCAPCHGEMGDGDGMVSRRGFPKPPTLHSERLRQAEGSHYYRVISQGNGAMYPLADRIAPGDRWAIIAYIRALQFSQHAPLQSLPAEDKQRLAEIPP